MQSLLDKKQKEELQRIVKNISVLARQSNIHLMIVLQSAGTENFQSTKDLNGKELGKGLVQEKTTKYYVARFVDRFGKRPMMKCLMKWIYFLMH